MTRSTFQGIVRSYGGQTKQSGTAPGVLVMSEVITFLSSTATSTPVSIGSTVNSAALFVLPQGAIPLSFAIVVPAGTTTTATVNIGSAANATGFAQNLVVGAKGLYTLTGTLVTGVGLTANTTVVASVGSTAGTGNVTGVITYTVVDNGAKGEQSGSTY